MLALDRLGGLQCPATGKDGETTEQDSLRLGQQVKAPVDGCPQRLLAGQRRPVAAGQQPKAVVQAGGDLLDRQHVHPRRGQFNRQRDAVEPVADLGHGRRLLVGQTERPEGSLRSLDEQPHRRVLHQLLGWREVAEVGQRERRQAQGDLTSDTQKFAARGQDAELGTRPQQPLGERRASVDQVLAVIQHEQERPGAQVLRQSSRERSATPFMEAEHQGHRLRHHGRVDQRRQFHQPDAVRVPWQDIGRNVQGEPRLPDPRRAGQGQEPRGPQQAGDLGLLVLTADKTREPGGQIAAWPLLAHRDAPRLRPSYSCVAARAAVFGEPTFIFIEDVH